MEVVNLAFLTFAIRSSRSLILLTTLCACAPVSDHVLPRWVLIPERFNHALMRLKLMPESFM